MISKVVHLTSVHYRYDVRIFNKECCSLASLGYDVSMVVADGLPGEEKQSVKIYGIEKYKNRLTRMLLASKKIYINAESLDADLYHIHDPELIPVGLKFKKRGKKVIFDSHEDVSMQIQGKNYLNPFVRKIASRIYASYERHSLVKFDLIVAATPFIRDKFSKWHSNVIDVNNYPILCELETIRTLTKTTNDIAYLGGITEIRGLRQVVQSLEFCESNVRLKIAGDFSSESFREELKTYPAWKQIDELGFINREAVKQLLSSVNLGLVTFLTAPNHINAQPNKIFEYMAAGLPVVASNFPLWKKIIEGNNCGLCVDPTEPKSIAEAIDWILAHPEEAQKMGENGRNAVQEKYNWANEEKKLISAYKNLVK